MDSLSLHVAYWHHPILTIMMNQLLMIISVYRVTACVYILCHHALLHAALQIVDKALVPAVLLNFSLRVNSP